MPTVTYKNQPAIEATKGNVPLAGTSHLYTVTKVLWSDSIQEFLQTLFVGKTLHVCCGMSLLGDVRVDLDSNHNPDFICDAAKLCFSDDSFDTVLCDPPYNGKFQWNHDMLSELSRVADKRLIFQHWYVPANKMGLYKKAQNKFELTQPYVWQGQTYFGRAQIISVFDRRNNKLLP
jgi:16S rRNA G966 N2-methylase RsmD